MDRYEDRHRLPDAAQLVTTPRGGRHASASPVRNEVNTRAARNTSQFRQDAESGKTMAGTLTSLEIEEYCDRMTTADSPLLQSLERATIEEQQDSMMLCGHLEGRFLNFLVSMSKARRVLEIGTFTGYSALSMAQALPDDGELITLDLDNGQGAATAAKYFFDSGERDKVRMILGNALDTIQTLTGTFDLVFIDADKENYINYYNHILDAGLLAQDGLIVIDNTLWSGRVVKEAQDERTKAVADFNNLVANDDRTEQVLLPIRDGITLVRHASVGRKGGDKGGAPSDLTPTAASAGITGMVVGAALSVAFMKFVMPTLNK